MRVARFSVHASTDIVAQRRTTSQGDEVERFDRMTRVARPNVRANRTTEAGRLAGTAENTTAGCAGQAACRSGSGG
jgi:hypothetical protein